MVGRVQTLPLDVVEEVNAADRKRRWLLSEYSENVWIVEDGVGKKKKYTISFDERMADGRMLHDHPKLMAAAKEFAFWIRAGNYTRIDSAERHALYGRTMVRLCYGLTARGIFSFSNLTSADIDLICEHAAMGIDGLTHVSATMREALEKFQSWEDVPQAFASAKKFDLEATIEAFRLPTKWSRKAIKSELNAATLRLNGKLVEREKAEPITYSQVQVVTNIFDALFALRHFIDAPTIKFRPFPEGPGAKAYELGSLSDPTPIADEGLVFRFLEGATKFVAEKSADIIKGHQVLVADRAIPRSTYLPVRAAWKDVHHLVTACYMLIAAFTARRSMEIKLLERDCLTGTDERGWWMKVYIVKTERQLTWMPVPPIVARAAQILIALNCHGPKDKGPLFEIFDPVLQKEVDVKPESRINEFARHVGAHAYANDNGEEVEWNWTTRQFRRFFAVLFFYRYRGKIETLAHHLRHFDLNMTNDYVLLDPAVRSIWTKEVFNFRIGVARDIVSGRATYTGPMGDRLNRLVERLRSVFDTKIQVMSEKMARVVLRTMKKHHLVVEPKAWVTCTCPLSVSGCQKAACRKSAGFEPGETGPNFAAAGPSVCPNCPWALVGNENLAYFDREIEAEAAGYIVDEPTIFGELQAAKLLTMRSFRAKMAA